MRLAFAAAAIVGALSASASTNPAPLSLDQAVQCMFDVLKSTPGVTEAKVGQSNEDGRTYPYVEFHAEQGWVQNFRFAPSDLFDKSQNAFTFLAGVSGLQDDASPPDNHVSTAVLDKWEAQCRVGSIFLST